MQTKSSKLLKLIIFALLGTISMMLMFLNFPVLPAYAFLKIDFSEVPALIAALLFTPIAGVIVELIKNLLYLVVTGATDPIGVVSNFLAGSLFVVPVAMLYHKFKGSKSLISGLATGTIAMTIGMSVLNYYLLLPAYSWFMGLNDYAVPAFKLSVVMAGILPFNVIKGIIVGLIFVPLFMKLRPWLEKKRVSLN